jgi:hypothetical protein
MSEWTRFRDKLPEEGQTIKVNGQWPFTIYAYFRKHKLGYAMEELRSQARLIVHEFKPNAVWMPIVVKEMGNITMKEEVDG